MEVISKRGGRRPGAGRKKGIKRSFQEAIDSIDVDGIIKKLEEWKDGKQVICSRCGEPTGVYVPDTVALQSAIELLNRRLGKPAQKTEIDITQTILLNADQVDKIWLEAVSKNPVLARAWEIAQREPVPIIEGEVRVLPSPVSQMDSSAKCDIVEGGVIEANYD